MSSSERSSAGRNADEVEFAALRFGAAPMSMALDDEGLSGSVADEAKGDPVERQLIADEEFLESLADATATEIDRRLDALGESYPFEVVGSRLRWRKRRHTAYEFMLAISMARSLTRKPWNLLPLEFERFAGYALCRSLGVGADWYRLGWPPAGDRPGKLREAVAELNRRIGPEEWLWNGTSRFSDIRSQAVKDGGVDLVVWKSWGDAMPGPLTLVGQCACGNNWGAKLADLRPRVFQTGFLSRMCAVDGCPQKFMAIPFHVADQNEFFHCVSAAGLLFDRARLCRLMESPTITDAERTDWNTRFQEAIGLVMRPDDAEPVEEVPS